MVVGRVDVLILGAEVGAEDIFVCFGFVYGCTLSRVSGVRYVSGDGPIGRDLRYGFGGWRVILSLLIVIRLLTSSKLVVVVKWEVCFPQVVSTL
jgi:hypothetical protein